MFTLDREKLQLEKSLARALPALCPDQIDAPVLYVTGGYFLVDDSLQQSSQFIARCGDHTSTVKPAQISWFNNMTLSQLGLAGGQIEGLANTDAPLNGEFRLKVCTELHQVMQQKFKFIVDYLSSREVDGQVLIDIPSISSKVADVIALHYEMQTNQASAQFGVTESTMFADQAEQFCQLLLELGGGRGILNGHALSLRTLVFTLSKLYLRK